QCALDMVAGLRVPPRALQDGSEGVEALSHIRVVFAERRLADVDGRFEQRFGVCEPTARSIDFGEGIEAFGIFTMPLAQGPLANCQSAFGNGLGFIEATLGKIE